MRTYPKLTEWVIRSALVVGSVAVAFSIFETYLRTTLPLETLFAGLQYNPEIASEGWQRAFVRDYSQIRRPDPGSDLLSRWGFQHDPELGWDSAGHLRSVRAYSVTKPANVLRVLTIGDSFTYGWEVGAEQTYSYYLEQRLASSEVLNMGVTAYGIDQAALKYLKYGRRYRPDIVVFAVIGPDYKRSLLTFYHFAKPRFEVGAAGDLTLTGTPIPSVAEVYRRLASELPPMSYTLALARSAYYSVTDPWPHESYFVRWDPLIEKIMERVLKAATEDGTKVLFLYIPTGDELATDAALGNHCCDRGHLAKIWKRLAQKYPSADAIDLMEVLPRQYSRSVVYEQMIIHHDGKPSGHLTPFGNKAVAEVIAQYLHRNNGAALADRAASD